MRIGKPARSRYPLVMRKLFILPVLIIAAPALGGCSKVAGPNSEEESVAQIENRADQISATADAAVNKQILDLEAAEKGTESLWVQKQK